MLLLLLLLLLRYYYTTAAHGLELMVGRPRLVVALCAMMIALLGTSLPFPY